MGRKNRCRDCLFCPKCHTRALLGQKVRSCEFQAVFCEWEDFYWSWSFSLPICPISSLPKLPQVLGPPVVKSREHTCIGRRRLGVLRVAAGGGLTELYTFFSSGSCCCVAQARLKLTTFLIILNGRLTGRHMPPPGPAAHMYV